MWHKIWSRIWNPSNRKVLCLNIVSSFILCVFLEYMERKSIDALLIFMQERTFVFLYNMLIIFVTLSIVFLVKKKYFAFGLIFSAWAMVGLVNGVILNSRKTPFTAVDLTIAKSTIPVITNYFSMVEIVLAICALTLAIAGLVTLFLYCPDARKSFDFRTNLFLVGLLLLMFGVSTYFGVGRGLLISRFDNLIAGYEDYGVAYGFCITAIDTGIDRPINYSRNKVRKLVKKMQSRLEKEDDSEKKTPNIIFIQLESFFDITDVKGIQLSEDPLPYLHALQQETTSGYVTVPVYGAGTINTEFEMITGMNVSYFGTGEYPYRSILHKRTCESMAYWLKEEGYHSSVIHNNNVSFYDRDYVFQNLGFDYFITIENMDIRSFNAAGWAKDQVLSNYIFDTMRKTQGQDYIYTISVQGHGDYPSDPVEDPQITVDGEDWDDDYRNTVTYYVNEIAEMDSFIGHLVEALSDYEEETILVVYGDHLPSLGFEGEDLTTASKYKTPYIIWDNYGYNASHKDDESGNLRSYQLPSKVLAQLGIHDGVMNLYHQTMSDTKKYKKNMKLLQYDLLYGSGFSREGQEKLEPTTLQYALDEVQITKLMKDRDSIYVMGSNFTDYSRVYVNGNPVNTEKVCNYVLKISDGLVKEGDELVIHQVSKTNERITLNCSEAYTVEKDSIKEVAYPEKDTNTEE